MLSIGELARRTRVSVRMLRHYDELGLVKPHRVDPATGYRWYSASQVGRVDSLVALKELGFTLAECRAILDENVTVEQLHGMLRRRHAELDDRIRADLRRLDEVGRRLRSIERGLTMTNRMLRLTPLPALRLLQVRTEVNDTTEISRVTGPLFEALRDRLAAAGTAVEGAGIRTFYGRPGGAGIEVAAAVEAPDIVPDVDGVELVDLPTVPSGARVVHRGPATEIADAWFTIDTALENRGLVSDGLHRQIFLEPPDQNGDCTVELQCPVRPSGHCE
ncbi:MAG TPA: MerR family transcriptional regulator [Candidatus Stackebrandtia excrementipullorum]|nr:MerR family transcriptional regulator [Candidatus Stackebrandtia excrementipullorum]